VDHVARIPAPGKRRRRLGSITYSLSCRHSLGGIAENLPFPQKLQISRMADRPGDTQQFACAISTHCPKVSGSPRPATSARQGVAVSVLAAECAVSGVHIVTVNEMNLVVQILLPVRQQARQPFAFTPHLPAEHPCRSEYRETLHHVFRRWHRQKCVAQNVSAASTAGQASAAVPPHPPAFLMDRVGQKCVPLTETLPWPARKGRVRTAETLCGENKLSYAFVAVRLASVIASITRGRSATLILPHALERRSTPARTGSSTKREMHHRNACVSRSNS